MITILKAQKDCAKTHKWTGEKWDTIAFGDVKTFTAEQTDCHRIDELYDIIRWLETEPQRCMIHGELIEGKNPTGARTLHAQKDGTEARFKAPEGAQWLCFDIDNMPCPEHLREGNDPEILMERMAHITREFPNDFKNVTFVYQWSNSAGLKNWDVLKCHIYFWMENLVPLPLIKARAKSEAWPIDLSALNAVQIHYTAAPKFVGKPDPLSGHRTGIYRGFLDAVVLSDWKAPEKPVLSPAQRMKQLDRVASGETLTEILDGIGEHLHGPISKAIGHYIVMTHPDARDREWLMSEIKKRVELSTRSDAKDFMDDAYLDRSYDGADGKYQPLDTYQMKLSLARQTIKKWNKQKGMRK